MTETPENDNQDQLPQPPSVCPACDVETMARRLNLDKRRVQQLAKEGKLLKDDRGLYPCEDNILLRMRELTREKRPRTSGLAKRQEESLEIRNARDRKEVLDEWEIMVLQKAIVAELAPMVLALRNGVREIENSLSGDIALFIKEQGEKIANGEPSPDYELRAKCQKMLSAPIREKLETFAKDIEAWAMGKNTSESANK